MLGTVDQIRREESLPETCRQYARDTITLGWEERLKVHSRRRSDEGREFATALPRGTILRAGDCLVVDRDRAIITVVERPEPVFVIEPRDRREWGLFAYQIGNRHQPLMITDTALVCPDVPGMEELLRQHHMPYVRSMQPFTPATAPASHSH